jgi:NADPH-dependent 2,4-dienoyl-CoA reductase/sulfur reductase-like enzyme
MGNVGNLNCAQPAHVSNDRSPPNKSTPSRIQRDLAEALRPAKYMAESNNADQPMIRRAAGKIPHVCIVGAGVAGLRCADVLLQHGAKVTIMEGRDRVGGRVPSTSRKSVEIGSWYDSCVKAMRWGIKSICTSPFSVPPPISDPPPY